jgi:hypothetical protein
MGSNVKEFQALLPGEGGSNSHCNAPPLAVHLTTYREGKSPLLAAAHLTSEGGKIPPPLAAQVISKGGETPPQR